MTLYKRLADDFHKEHIIYWSHLSRLTHVLILLNISLFFVTNLVNTAGYFYTYYSIGFLAIIEIGLLLPLGLLRKLPFYLMHLILLGTSSYFLISSVVYWIKMSSL